MRGELARPGSVVGDVAAATNRAPSTPPTSTRAGADYRFAKAYNRAKLANLLFTYELSRRLEAAGAPTIAVAGHPGLARTEGARDLSWVVRTVSNHKVNPIVRMLSQSAAKGALGPIVAQGGHVPCAYTSR